MPKGGLNHGAGLRAPKGSGASGSRMTALLPLLFLTVGMAKQGGEQGNCFIPPAALSSGH